LLDNYRSLRKTAEQTPSPSQDQQAVREAVAQLAHLYDAWDKPEEAAKWRKELPAPPTGQVEGSQAPGQDE
jgi:hypothetical protein